MADNALQSLLAAGLTPEQIKQLNLYTALTGIKKMRDAGFQDSEIFGSPQQDVYGAGLPGATSPSRLAGGYGLLGPATTLAGITSANQLGRGNLALDAQKERFAEGTQLANEAADPGNIVKVLQLYANSKIPNPIDNPVLQNIAPSHDMPAENDYIARLLASKEPSDAVKLPNAAAGATADIGGVNPGDPVFGGHGGQSDPENQMGAYATDMFNTFDGLRKYNDAMIARWGNVDLNAENPYQVTFANATDPTRAENAAKWTVAHAPPGFYDRGNPGGGEYRGSIGTPGYNNGALNDGSYGATAQGASAVQQAAAVLPQAAPRSPAAVDEFGAFDPTIDPLTGKKKVLAASGGAKSFTLEHPTVGIDTVTGQPDMTLSENGPEQISQGVGGGMKVTPKPGVPRGLTSKRQDAMIRKVMPSKFAGLTRRGVAGAAGGAYFGFDTPQQAIAASAAAARDASGWGNVVKSVGGSWTPPAAPAVRTATPSDPLNGGSYNYGLSEGTFNNPNAGQSHLGSNTSYIRDASGQLSAVANPDSTFQGMSAHVGAWAPTNDSERQLIASLGDRYTAGMNPYNMKVENRTYTDNIDAGAAQKLNDEMRSQQGNLRLSGTRPDGSISPTSGMAISSRDHFDYRPMLNNMFDYGVNWGANQPRDQVWDEYTMPSGGMGTGTPGHPVRGATPTGRQIAGWDDNGNPVYVTGKGVNGGYTTAATDWSSGLATGEARTAYKPTPAGKYGPMVPNGIGGASGAGAGAGSGSGSGSGAGSGSGDIPTGDQTALQATARLFGQGIRTNTLLDPQFADTLDTGAVPGLGLMSARTFNSLNPTRKKVLLAVWKAAGYSNDDVMAALDQNRPAGR